MKKIGIVIGALVFSTAVFGQVENQKKEVKKEVKIEREIKVTEENGQTKLEETTIENGVVKQEVFVGDAAKKRLEELKKEEAKAEGKGMRMEKRVKMETKEVEKEEIKPIEEKRKN